MGIDLGVLGQSYFSLDAASVDKSPSEIVITENETTYYIVSRDIYENGPQQQGFKIVVSEGE